MIKRDGIEIMNARSGNVSIARQTIEITKQKHYVSPNGNTVDISQAVDLAIKGTILYKGEMPKKSYSTICPTLEVVNETTDEAAIRLLANKTNVAALNFASARNQGGGFLAGAIAQEEDLCRCSSLYACLKSKPMFYNENILCDDTFYTHNIIYSPNVPFFRNRHNVLLEEPFPISIISAPAPNLYAVKKDGLTTFLMGLLRERAIKILEVAEAHGHKTLILGAWGCGAFNNDPEMVAQAFMFALKKVPTFEHICFAVYDKRQPAILYETFDEIVGKNDEL